LVLNHSNIADSYQTPIRRIFLTLQSGKLDGLTIKIYLIEA